jgi:hypothetical protein
MRTSLLAPGLVILLWGAIVCAESTAADKALAQTLFREGRTLLTSGKTAEACDKFAESDRLDPQVGTHLNLALCHEAQGKTASAWVEFGEVADQADRVHGDEERGNFARQHARDLEAKLARVRLHVTTGAPGMTIRIDTATLGQAAWATAVPLDPGKHEIRAEAPGKKPSVQSIDVPQGPATTDATIPALEDAPAPRQANGTLRTAGFVTAGVGALGLVAGGIFGVMAISQNSTANDHCKFPGDRCDPTGVSAGQDASTSAAISTVTFIAGAALVAGGAVLIFVGGPSRTNTGVNVVPLPGGLQVVGRF